LLSFSTLHFSFVFTVISFIFFFLPVLRISIGFNADPETDPAFVGNAAPDPDPDPDPMF
jgi:hypothetical protein